MLRAAMLMVMAAALAAFPLAGVAAGDATRDALQKRAEAGDVQAQLALGRALQDDGQAADKAAGAEWFRKAALAGNAEGAWMYGTASMAGEGVARDQVAAIDWMRKSVNQDQNPDHMAVLAVALLSAGNAQPEALQWAQKSVDKGSTKGMEVMAMARLSGQLGLPKDTALAEKLMTTAAQKGDADAQLSLGQFYLTGMFGRQDAASGQRWLQTAADSGSAKAAGTLAYFLITGKEGVPVDAARGVALAKKAVAGHEMLGHYALGVAYVTGAGVAENPAEGWYEISLAQRMDNQQQLKTAADYLAKASTKLTPAQLAQLKARVDAAAGKSASDT